MEINEILNNIHQKYQDAILLKEHERHANAIYLSGYCVELALKYAITKHLSWNKFQSDGKFKFLKVHDLDLLTSLTGQELAIKTMPAWSTVNQWSEVKRYSDTETATSDDAESMLKAVKILVEFLCKISLQK